MSIEPRVDAVDHVRRLAASDPRQARAYVQELLQSDQQALSALLQTASRPGDGRIRQVIAVVYRTTPQAAGLRQWLERWIAVEADEFTKSAIATALNANGQHAEPRTAARSNPLAIVDAYRYVADRLCHRIRNAMTLPSAQLLRLKQLVEDATDPVLRHELAEIYAGMQVGLTRISRNVEFDASDGYTTWQTIHVIPWLERNKAEWMARHGDAKCAITHDHAIKKVAIRATPFLLDTILVNLWTNAIQIPDAVPQLEIQLSLDSARKQLEFLFLDSGPGFPEAQLDSAFQEAFSTKSATRGRGLLEIADAVTRLQGSVRLLKHASRGYRIAISLPVEST